MHSTEDTQQSKAFWIILNIRSLFSCLIEESEALKNKLDILQSDCYEKESWNVSPIILTRNKP